MQSQQLSKIKKSRSNESKQLSPLQSPNSTPPHSQSSCSPANADIEKNPDWIQVGVVGKAHGLKGAFFLSARSGELGLNCQTLYFGPDLSAPIFKSQILDLRIQGKQLLVLCESISDRNQAEALKGSAVWIYRDELGKDLLWNDLIGTRVLDNRGCVLGRVEDVQNFGASDILVVGRSQDQKKLNLAFVPTMIELPKSYKNLETLSLLLSESDLLEFWNA